ncbi:MAG TPA: IS66 family transposase [Sphaerochaeta sp.]|nr:IS66 family transposase [Sphaerochaeta sp.]
MDKKSEKNKYAEVRIEDLHTLLANLPEDPQSLVAVIESLVRIIVADSTSDIQALLSVIESLAKQNAELVEKISELTALVTSLLEQNKKDNSAKSNDSSNSNLPPSASNPSKSTGNLTTRKVDKNLSLRKMTQEKPGRLPGHEGSGMKLKEISDRIVNIFPDKCLGCENIASCMQGGKVCDKRYTKDIEIKELQTEYRNWEFQCPNKANETLQGTFPIDITGSKQYGEHIKNLVILLRMMGIISYDRIAKICSALGFDFSTGTLFTMCKNFAGKCDDVRPLITSLLQSSLVLGVDETGGNINGKKIWHHDTVSEDATLITAHKVRGLIGTLAAGVMQDFMGIVVHDFWGPYFNLEHVTHAMCVAHLERENNKAQALNPEHQWPTLMNDLFHGLISEKNDCQQLGLRQIPEEALRHFFDRYDEILEIGEAEDPIPLVGKKLKKNGEPRKPALSDSQNLRKRYKKYREEILRFATDFNVPVSNNHSERGFRILKLAYNVFGCFRTAEGADDFSMMQSILDTGRKQGFSPKDIVSSVFKENYLDIFNDKSRGILLANGAIPALV